MAGNSKNDINIMDRAKSRLQQLQNTLGNFTRSISESPLLILPDDSRVYVSEKSNSDSTITIDDKEVLSFQVSTEYASLLLSAIGTSFENDELVHVPKYAILKLTTPHDSRISIPDLWGSIYALWNLYHEQEHIPIILSSSIGNYIEILDYLLYSGLGRLKLDAQPSSIQNERSSEVFLVRATFWQGAGIGLRWGNDRGWLRGTYTERTSTFPQTQSFTRTPLAITAHPLRPPKPQPGECIYKRYCVPVKKMISFHMFNPASDLHMETFHRWHNDERVHKGWGERGTMEKHREYIRKQIKDPHILPIMMSWDDELMGYSELVWIRENHIAAYIPDGPLDYDRGLHVLCGEDKYRGSGHGQAWFRSVTHYIFLADSRTKRIIGEPKKINAAIIKTSVDAGMHLQTTFDFPYKRSVMTMNLRERFFKEDMLL